MRNIFSQEVTVKADAIDDLNHVNNVVYLQWLMDVAEAHWKANASKKIQGTYVWVALNHYIEYKAEAFEGDTLSVETWIESLKGVRSERHYRIINKKTKKTVVIAKTNWCLLHAESKRPARIPEEILNLF